MPRRDTALVLAAALLLFGTGVSDFASRVTDISALRVLDGEVPYRDFWTMYAPGSFTTLALAFALFGRELIVSNLLGIVTSAAAVAMFYRLARRVAGTSAALAAAALVAAAFFGSGYSGGFGSYPPAFLLILAAADRTAAACREPRPVGVILPAVLLGGAALFKHDVAAYAVIALALALVVVRARARQRPIVAPALVLGLVPAAIVGAAAAILTAAGAGSDLWRDLVVFPLTDFRHVRPEYFPLVPNLRGLSIDTIRELVLWGTCNLPLLALAAGTAGIIRRRGAVDDTALFAGVAGFALFWLHWAAAHVQINTHVISLTAWGTLVAGAGLRPRALSQRPGLRLVVSSIVLGWGLLLVAERVYLTATRPPADHWVGVPRLSGIRASAGTAAWMRQLAAAMSEADPKRPLLLLSSRNDVHVFVEPTPFWLSARTPATRHHELHPGITDTPDGHRGMLAAVQAGPLPVVVREYRFSDEVLDAVKADMSAVPIGSLAMDEWVTRHYEPGPRFGPYEIMHARADPSPAGRAPSTPGQ